MSLYTRENSRNLATLVLMSARDKSVFAYRVRPIINWNALPDNIATSCSVSNLKRNIAQIDLSKQLL